MKDLLSIKKLEGLNLMGAIEDSYFYERHYGKLVQADKITKYNARFRFGDEDILYVDENSGIGVNVLFNKKRTRFQIWLGNRKYVSEDAEDADLFIGDAIIFWYVEKDNKYHLMYLDGKSEERPVRTIDLVCMGCDEMDVLGLSTRLFKQSINELLEENSATSVSENYLTDKGGSVKR